MKIQVRYEFLVLSSNKSLEVSAAGSILICSVCFLAVLSETPPSFTITVTSEAGENDESKHGGITLIFLGSAGTLLLLQSLQGSAAAELLRHCCCCVCLLCLLCRCGYWRPRQPRLQHLALYAECLEAKPLG